MIDTSSKQDSNDLAQAVSEKIQINNNKLVVGLSNKYGIAGDVTSYSSSGLF